MPLVFSVSSLLAVTVFVLPPWFYAGSGLRFESPWFLFGFLFIPAVVAAHILKRKNSGRIVFSMARLIGTRKQGFRIWMPNISLALKTAALALLVLALARPQDANRQTSSTMEGIDIVLTLDMSGSMATPDIAPNRVEAAKAVVLDFIRRRKNDRIGAVVFAENAYTLCPLTLDYTVLSQMIEELKLGVISDKKTAIGNAVGVSINRLRKSDAKTKTIILVTDGTSNAGNISPEQATQFAKTLGIKIYTILVGQNRQSQSINPALLIEMANKTGGAFFKATGKTELISSFHTILDALERSKIEDMGVTYAEVFDRYLWPALILIILDLIIGLFVIRRTP
jgi:Ca-activated chloride channel family protein